MIANKKTIRLLNDNGYDTAFIEKTQPRGGLKFNDTYITTGNGYVTCIELYEFAETVSYRWLYDLMALPDTIATLDIQTANKAEVVQEINKSLGELSYRTDNEQRTTDKSDALMDKLSLEEFAKMITQKGEVVKNAKIRIFVYNNSLDELETRVNEIRKDLSALNHSSIVPVFRMKDEFLSLFSNADEQEKLPLTKKGLAVPAINIGGGIPFHHKSLKDPRGFYVGKTSTGGPFMFDPFYSTTTRRSFNGFVLGKMGFGKSTLLKQFEEGLFGKNAFIRGFDKSGEYETMIKEQGGVYVDLSGGDMMVNPLQILATVLKPDGSVDEVKSFQNHLDKCANQLRNLEPDMNNATITDYKALLRDFYVALNLLPKGWLKTQETTNICDLNNNQYPTYSQFREYIKNQKYSGATPERLRSIELISLVIDDMCDTYPTIFDGITTMPNFDEEKVVYYNIDAISKLDEKLFQCQLFTALTTIWNSALRNGKKYKYLIENRKIKIEDIEYFMVFIDECHNIINPKNPYACEYVKTFEREMRKFYAGVYFATQSPQEIIPSQESSEVIQTIRTIFELCTVKVLFNLDASLIADMKSILGNTVTDSEVQLLPELSMGEAIVQTSSADSYIVQFDPDNNQLERFKGGQ